MSDLERQYREGMRFYTARWRRNNGDALLSTLIDGAEAEHRTEATGTEIRDLTRTGLKQRAGALLPYVLFAIALCSLLVLAVLSTDTFGSTGNLSGALPVLPVLAYTGYVFPPPIPTVYPPPWTYLAAAGVCLTCLVLGFVTLRRNRRLLRD